MTRAAKSPLYPLYRAATALIAGSVPRWLAKRAAAGKEDSRRLSERQGIAPQPRPAGALVWCHGASVGEALTLLPLVEELIARGQHVLVTTGTVTSASLMAERLPVGAVHQYVPLDIRRWARRFLDHWQPTLVVWAESELWPNMLAEIAVRDIPAYLVNARLSDKAFRGWRRWPGFARAVLSAFTAVLAQSAEDARRFSALGAPEVSDVGNLKLSGPALPADAQSVAALTAAIGVRPHWLAASIHPGEDAIVAGVHAALKVRFQRLLTVVAPRHPPKADAMAATFTSQGLAVARRSRGEAVTDATDIYLADTMGELGALYRACDLVMMGKSFAVGGGQNPAEPAKIGCAVLCGPDMSNFRELTVSMRAASAMLQVPDPAALTEAIARLLGDDAARRQMAADGFAFMAREGNALAATLAVLEPRLTNP